MSEKKEEVTFSSVLFVTRLEALDRLRKAQELIRQEGLLFTSKRPGQYVGGEINGRLL